MLFRSERSFCKSVEQFVRYYNEVRPHQTLKYQTPQAFEEKYYAATLEYRFPIAKKVQGVVFTDMGSTWGIDEGKIPWYKDDNSLNFSVGVGLRLQTPIGPIRLDYGHGDRNKFHFSFGTQF